MICAPGERQARAVNAIDESVREFLDEAQENMGNVYKSLELMEANPHDTVPARRLSRSVRTIKGAAGFFNLATLENVGHYYEDILSKLGDGKISLTPERRALLYEATGATLKTITCLVETGREGEEKYADLIFRLREESRMEVRFVMEVPLNDNSYQREPRASSGNGRRMLNEKPDNFGFPDEMWGRSRKTVKTTGSMTEIQEYSQSILEFIDRSRGL